MRARKGRGYSLIELLVVVGLVGLIAAVAVPALLGDDEATLDRAAAEVASAIRFAHAEAVRTGRPHGVIADMSDQSIKIYRLDESVDPPVVHYDVYQPLSKQLYDLRFSTRNTPASISEIYFKFKDRATKLESVRFAGTTGVPTYEESGTIRILENGYIRLSHDGMNRTVAVSALTSRVTVQ